MNKIFKFTLVTFLLFNFIYIKPFELKSLNFYEWYNKCKDSKISEEDFLDIIKKSNDVHTKTLKHKNSWPLLKENIFEELNNYLTNIQPKLYEYMFDTKKAIEDEFENIRMLPEIDVIFPHSAKLITPSNSTTYVFGDLHGNFNDLSYILTDLIENEKVMYENFELSKNINLIFLGDYTDRGDSGLELLTTLMLLKIKNPNNVFLLRGNHENLVTNITYGFFDEIFKKIKCKQNKDNIIKQIAKSYELMPAAFYLGNESQPSFVHLSHAGFEIRNNPKNLIEAKIQNNQNLQFNSIDPIYKEKQENTFSSESDIDNFIKDCFDFKINEILHSMWNDFYEFDEDKIIFGLSSRGNTILRHNYKFLEYILKKYKIENKFVKFIRGHSHNHVKFYNKEEPEDDAEFKKQCRKYTKGVTSINKKVITLISGSIQYDDYAMNFVPTYLKLTQQWPNNDWHVEAKYLNEELLD